ncbi:arylamine N-acetyltransferase, pineal gland isozyme NAT-10-like isoform 1-T2 [Synchiropus picturatus]
MNLQEYFRKIGFHGSYDKPDLLTLRQIHKQHILSIPFENFSIHCGERNHMDLEVVFNKLVRCNRGGWCYENNFLFSWVLKELGYEYTILSSKIFNNSIDDFALMDTHLIMKVVIDGETFICDVSYGMMSQVWYPLELISGKDQTQPAGVFRLMDKGEFWVLERNRRQPRFLNPDFQTPSLVDKKDIVPIYCFTLTPRHEDHFLEFNERLQVDANSLYTKMSMCSLQTLTGFRALIGLIYSEVTFLPEEGVNVLDSRILLGHELLQILWEKFNVQLRSTFTPKGAKASKKYF